MIDQPSTKLSSCQEIERNSILSPDTKDDIVDRNVKKDSSSLGYVYGPCDQRNLFYKIIGRQPLD